MRKVYCYSLHVQGLFGRKRKPQREIFYLRRYSSERVPLEQVTQVANAMLKEINLRGSYTVQEREGALENLDGVEIYSTVLIGGAATLLMGVA